MTHTFLKGGLSVIALAALTACGGTGAVSPSLSASEKAILKASDAASSISSRGVDSSGRLSFAGIADVAADVNAGYNAVGITPKASVPVRGSATYKGAVGGTVDGDGGSTTVGGLMSLGVDFDENRVGGFIGNMVTESGDQINGTLAVTNGRISRTSNSTQAAIFADVKGTLADGNENVRVDAKLKNSGFKGPNAEFVGGDIEGDVIGSFENGTIDLKAQLVR